MLNLQKSSAILAKEDETLAALQHLIGTPYSMHLKQSIARLSGFSMDDVVGPEDSGVMRYQIYVNVNQNSTITSFSFTQ